MSQFLDYIQNLEKKPELQKSDFEKNKKSQNFPTEFRFLRKSQNSQIKIRILRIMFLFFVPPQRP